MVHWCGFHAAMDKSECMVYNTVISCYSNSCCQTSVKLLATFASQRIMHACARELSCCDTRLRSHQTWPPNRPDLSSVGYRLLTVIQECVCQKQQEMSNIVDELWLLTEWHYILQGRVETPIRIGGQLCCSSVANLLQYLCAKNCQNTMQLDRVISKIELCNFFAPQCSLFSVVWFCHAMLYKRGAMSVRMSVCLSRSWILSKRINTSSKMFHTKRNGRGNP